MDSALPMPPLYVATDAALSARGRYVDRAIGVGVDSFSTQSFAFTSPSDLTPSSGSLAEQGPVPVARKGAGNIGPWMVVALALVATGIDVILSSGARSTTDGDRGGRLAPMCVWND